MDPDREELDRRIAEAKRSMARRLDELGERVGLARRRFAIGPQLRDHLGVSLGAAAAVGFLLGGRPGAAARPGRTPGPSGLLSSALEQLVRSAIAAAAAAIVARLLREPTPGVPGERPRLATTSWRRDAPGTH